MEIWDPAGSERYRSLVQTFFRGLHGVIYAYDITDRTSYDSLKSYWIEHLASKQVIRQEVLKLLVGNKSDLAPSKRAVPFEEAQVGRNGDRAKRQQLWLVTLWPVACHTTEWRYGRHCLQASQPPHTTTALCPTLPVGFSSTLYACYLLPPLTTQEYAKSIGIPFLEASAKDGKHIEKAFQMMAAAIREGSRPDHSDVLYRNAQPLAAGKAIDLSQPHEPGGSEQSLRKKCCDSG